MSLRDDWGTAEGLLVAPEMWRDLFRPLYRQYCNILHAGDKFVFFHSGGNILDIFGDLVKLGVNAIHADLHLMDHQRLAKRYRGRVTFWGGMDPRRLREPGTAEEFRESVLAVRRTLDFGAGGVIAPMPMGPRRPAANGGRVLRAMARAAADARLLACIGGKAALPPKRPTARI